MIDYTIEIKQQCSNGSGMDSFSENGRIYTCRMDLDGSRGCNCDEFKKSHQAWCKHLEKLSSSLCDWHEMFSEEVQTNNERKNKICPKCGASTVSVRVGV